MNAIITRATALATVALLGATAGQARDLTIEKRIQAQEAIERVYHSHQTGDVRRFEEAVPRALLEEKVATYLKQSAALDAFWKSPITADMLRREIRRMAEKSQMPGRLRELYAALGNDPFLIQETLGRPALADRLSRSLFADDTAIHAGERQEAERLRADLEQGRLDARSEHPRRSVVDLVRTDGAGEERAPGKRLTLRARGKNDPTRLELQPDEFEGHLSRLPIRIGEVGTIEESREAFLMQVVLSRSEGEVRVAVFTVPKLSWDEWWNSVADHLDEGSIEAVASAESGSSEVAPDTACLDDAWTSVSSSQAPSSRFDHTSVWTGNVMIVWGGFTISDLNTGGRYDPALDTWTPTSTVNAPAARRLHTGIWTGSHMVVWGGFSGSYGAQTGGRYDPITDSWTATSMTSVPPLPWDTLSLASVWTGSRMLVWATGFSYSAPACDEWCTDPVPEYFGGRYDPASDTWSPMSLTNAPYVVSDFSVVWTGSRMVVWGGVVGYDNGYPIDLSVGSRYDPVLDAWTPISTLNGPSPRSGHAAVWTGSRMIVWGGSHTGSYLDTGGRYDPVTDTWTPTSTANAPLGRDHHTAVWTGDRMVIWGGNSGPYLDTGSRYDPGTDTWAGISATGAPSARSHHTSVWTGSGMTVWGGYDGTGLSSGGQYALGSSVDGDGDGWNECQGDCNDGNAAVHPGGTELCNGSDDDCDGVVDEGNPAGGGAGCLVPGALGVCTAGVTSCAAGPLSCIPTVAPSVEVCDGLDNNCDGIVDNAPVPLGSPSVSMILFGQTAVLGWSPLPGAGNYDVIQGELMTLRNSGGNFTTATQACLGNDVADTALVLSGSPPVGGGSFYLVRGTNCGGPGTFDSLDLQQIGSRDAEIHASVLSCP